MIAGDAFSSYNYLYWGIGFGYSIYIQYYTRFSSWLRSLQLFNYLCEWYSDRKLDSSNPAITLNLDTLIRSDAPIGNQWYFNDSPISGATDQYYIFTSEGSYYTIVTINGCSSARSNSINVVVDGIHEINSRTSSTFEIYPVPNNGQFTVMIITLSEKHFDISIHNAAGIKIYEVNDIIVNGKLEYNIDIDPVGAGIYYVMIRSNDEQAIRKVLKM